MQVKFQCAMRRGVGSSCLCMGSIETLRCTAKSARRRQGFDKTVSSATVLSHFGQTQLWHSGTDCECQIIGVVSCITFSADGTVIAGSCLKARESFSTG